MAGRGGDAPRSHVAPDDSAEPDTSRPDLGSAVRARRRRLGLRLSDVAARTGLSVPFLSQIETNFATPSLTSLFAVADVLATSPERLLAGPGAGGGRADPRRATGSSTTSPMTTARPAAGS